MNKTQLIEAIAEETGLSKKDVTATVNSALSTIIKALKKKDKVQLIGFGSFAVRKRSARIARNPQTGELIKIKASKVPVFKAGRTLKDAVK